jgi:hypothetical protein
MSGYARSCRAMRASVGLAPGNEKKARATFWRHSDPGPGSWSQFQVGRVGWDDKQTGWLQVPRIVTTLRHLSREPCPTRHEWGVIVVFHGWNR